MSYILYADGGSRGNPGPSGAGAVIYRDEVAVAEISLALGTTTNNVAEYTALLEGLKKLQEVNTDSTPVEVRMDSELVIKQMRGEYKVKHPNLKHLHLEAQNLAGNFAHITYTHIPREKNGEADALANAAMDTASSAR